MEGLSTSHIRKLTETLKGVIWQAPALTIGTHTGYILRPRLVELVAKVTGQGQLSSQGEVTTVNGDGESIW